MKRQQWHIIIAKIHKWAGITVGIQLFLWLLGGFVMSWFNIDDVRGSHLVRQPDKAVFTSDTYDMKALDNFVQHSKRPLQNVTIGAQHGMPFFIVRYQDGRQALLDPKTAEAFSPLKEKFIRDLAQRLYNGAGVIKAVALKKETGIEYRGPLPVWQVDFRDEDQTSFYFHPDTGRLMSVRSDLWRFYDFMWMLHIMDYDTRDDFNHPLLYIFALVAVFFALSGFVLAGFRFGKKDFRWLTRQ